MGGEIFQIHRFQKAQHPHLTDEETEAQRNNDRTVFSQFVGTDAELKSLNLQSLSGSSSAPISHPRGAQRKQSVLSSDWWAPQPALCIDWEMLFTVLYWNWWLPVWPLF